MRHVRVVIAGNDGGTNIGASFLRAAPALGVDAELSDTRRAYEGSRLLARVNWWLRDRRPSRLREYSDELIERCRRVMPTALVATGLAPIERRALDKLRAMGVETINYLTDDPWNPVLRSAWFLDALNAYDRVFSVRRRNLDDLRRAGCRHVEYLPFAVDPALSFPETANAREMAAYRSDVCFVGGADRDRVPFIAALRNAGLAVALYGDRWDRYPETRSAWRGHASPGVLRKATAAAAVSLCLVRRANRDGHTMRSFEVPAMGGCMLVEETDEHRDLFGENDVVVRYFQSAGGLAQAAAGLLANPSLRRRLAAAALAWIGAHRHTYRDRLHTMLDWQRARVTTPPAGAAAHAD